MQGEKASWELHKNDMGCFEQILEAALRKIAAVWPLTSYLTNHPRWTRHTRHCWRSKDKLISNVFLWTPTHGMPVLADQQGFMSVLCRHWMQSRGLSNRNGWRERERVREFCAISTTWWWISTNLHWRSSKMANVMTNLTLFMLSI